MEEITVRELKQIPVERTSIAPADRTRHKLVRYKRIQHKRERRDKSARWLIRVAAASLAMNMVQWVIIYILQAGPI